jgi:CheY-like chemotaxis protein
MRRIKYNAHKFKLFRWCLHGGACDRSRVGVDIKLAKHFASLSDLGCESVTTAATVDQALALMNERVFDVAMLDVNLNGQKSYPVADALAARRVPFVFATGYSDHVTKEGYPGRPVLKKPFKFEARVEVLARLACPERVAAAMPPVAPASGGAR